MIFGQAINELKLLFGEVNGAGLIIAAGLITCGTILIRFYRLYLF
ncbi:MAG: hypothetical protein AWU54_1735 [Candidatus Frackibacter sp. T328-2]|nr:MAG: hypothetical protein AWU54_1735 [Candidatus Frackibacter sp. T328-2]